MTTQKWTCDPAGRWALVEVRLERVGAGWKEAVAVAGATATGRAA